MYFSSLSIITTLACAVFSVAAPLPQVPPTVSGVEGTVAGVIKNKLGRVARDVPATPKLSVPNTLSDLVNQLSGVANDISEAVQVDVKVGVSSEKVVSAAHKLIPILEGVVAKVQYIAQNPTEFVLEDETVGPVVGEVINVTALALATAVKAVGTAEGTLLPVVSRVSELLGTLVNTVVKEILPSALALIVAKVTPVVTEIYYLNLDAVIRILGLSPVV